MEFARALSEQYEVTLAAQGPAGGAAQGPAGGEREGMRVVPFTRRRLLREALRHDAILSSCLPPYLLALKPLHDFLAITDQYDPHELELATLKNGRHRDRGLRSRAGIRAIQLRHADMVLCAAESQRTELARVARSLAGNGTSSSDPIVIPFGIPDPPPVSSRRPLHDRFPEIAPGDTIVLWWGSVWRWLDAETAVRAFAQIAAIRPDVKLVLTAGRPPNRDAGRLFDATEDIRALAQELGVLGRSVLFLDEWIPYEQRHDYLREADIGLTLHRHAAEAQLAARARYMDYLSAELPCVLGRGDETAEDFGAAGFATLLDEPTPEQLLEALLALVDDREALAAARAAGKDLAAERNWSAVGAKLRAAIAEVSLGTRATRPAPLALATGAGAYYMRRVIDRVAAAN